MISPVYLQRKKNKSKKAEHKQHAKLSEGDLELLDQRIYGADFYIRCSPNSPRRDLTLQSNSTSLPPLLKQASVPEFSRGQGGADQVREKN